MKRTQTEMLLEAGRIIRGILSYQLLVAEDISLSRKCRDAHQLQRLNMFCWRLEHKQNQRQEQDQRCDICGKPCRDNDAHVHLCDECFKAEFKREPDDDYGSRPGEGGEDDYRAGPDVIQREE